MRRLPIPRGLRPRMLAFVVASIVLSTLMMLAHEIGQRRNARLRMLAEAELLSRYAASLAVRSLGDDGVPGREHVVATLNAAARDAGAVVRSGYASTLPEAVSFVLVDARGRVIARPSGQKRPGDSLLTPFEARTNAEWCQSVRSPDGHERLIAFTPLPHHGDTSLWVGAGLDVDAMLGADARGLWLSLGAVALLGLLVSVAAWWSVSVGVLRGVNALLAATDRLRRGDLGARTDLGGEPGELGALARRFDEMAETLERRSDERRRVEEELRLSEARKSAVLESSLDGILLLDGGGRVLECNASARRMFGCRGGACVHHRLDELFPGSFLAAFPAEGPEPGIRETTCRRLDRKEFPTEISIAPIREPGARGLFVASVRDVTERRMWEESLAAMSYLDDLTGLYNRRGFLMFASQQLKLASRAEHSVVLVGVDLDGLKRINDTHGHANGDRALVELAGALRASFRESDVVGRMGGDEFVVLATESHDEGAEHALERLAMRLAGRNAVGDLPWRLSASVGWVRTVPCEGEDLAALLECVDARMYEQKRGRAGSRAVPDAAPLAPPRAAAAPEPPRCGAAASTPVRHAA